MRADQGLWPVQASVELGWLEGDVTWNGRQLVTGWEWADGERMMGEGACPVAQELGE